MIHPFNPGKLVVQNKEGIIMGDVIQIEQFYVTFGVQYTLNPEHGEQHPLGMHGNGYAIVEAPDIEVARKITNAIFDDKYAFLYDEDEFIKDGMRDRWYSSSNQHLLTIAWVWPFVGGAA